MKHDLISSAFVVTDERKCMKPHPDQIQAQHHNPAHAAFVPLGHDPGRSPETFSLQVSSEVINEINAY